MAGISTYPFASQCLKYGADLVFSPMLHTDFVTNNIEEAIKIADYGNCRYIIQLVGSEPHKFIKAINLLQKSTNSIGFDLNMGCPDKNTVKSGCGGALMKNFDLSIDIVKAMKSATSKPISVKTRVGYDNENDIFKLVEKLENENVSLLTIHPRKVIQMYRGKASWGIIKRVKKSTKIPICGSGDIKDYHQALKKHKETACDGLMIGRGALGKPWIFKEIKEEKKIEISQDEIKNIVTEISKEANRIWGNKGIIELRKQYAWFFKNTKNAKELREKLVKASTYDEVIEILAER